MAKNKVHGAFIYARYSTDNQNADSIDVQIERCSNYCQERGLPILGVYPDAAISGMKLSRPSYDRMISDLRDGMADTVVIYDQSRLFRNMDGWFSMRKELDRLDVQILSCTQQFVGGDLRDPTTFILESNTAILNQMWVLLTRQKVMAKLRYKAKNGEWTGGKPALGYKVVDGRLAIDEEEAEIVRRVFGEYASGRSYRDIIAGLNRDGIKTKRGNAFGNNSLHDLMKNELYIGVRLYGARPYRADGTRNNRIISEDAIRVEDYAPAIISKETFYKVQELMTVNKKKQGGRPATVRDYPLKGKVFCGECGSSMTVVSSKSKGLDYHYYRCTKKDRMHNCTGRPIRCDELEEDVVKHVRAMMGSPDIKDRALQYVKEHADKITMKGVEVFKRKQEQLNDVEKKIENIVNAIADGNYIPSMRDKLKELESEKEKILHDLQSIHRTANISVMPSEKLEKLFNEFCSMSKEDDAAVLSIVTRVEVYSDWIRVYTAFDPDPTKKDIIRTDLQDEMPEEFIITQGVPSGVPRIFITSFGLCLEIGRRR